MHFVYVLYSQNYNRFYIGMTQNVEIRLKQHNSGKTNSTKGYRPWKVLFYEVFETRELARKREIFLKTGYGRQYIKTIWSRSSTG